MAKPKTPRSGGDGDTAPRPRRGTADGATSVAGAQEATAHAAQKGHPPSAAGRTPQQRGVRRDSRGRVIPDTVKRLPSGRLPANWHYAGKKYDGPRWTPKLQQKYPDGVMFTDDGFPDFSPYAIRTVRFDPPGFEGNHGSDFAEANRLAGLPETPDGYTWHHHQDMHTMQLIDLPPIAWRPDLKG